MDYQKTLNLPKTDFPMRAGLAQREPLFLQRWEKENLYPEIRKKLKGKKVFILHDGPPYANGHIHIGHALNKILKDFIVKMKTMQGFDCPYIPGWDCHGLPIEHQLFKELKKHKHEVDCVAFRKKAQEFALKFVGIQREEFKRLGVFGEWEQPYLTLTPEYEYWILNSLSRLTQMGYVYRGLKPVNWCFQCETALAEAEVEYADHVSPSIYVKFLVNNPAQIPGIPQNKKLYLLIWTTTPWTLMANIAVAVHEKYQYAIVECENENLIMEASLVSPVMAKVQNNNFKILKDIPGKELAKLVYTHPFDIRENCRVIAVNYVSKEEGTGLVHTAPGHGQEDYEAGLTHSLEILMPVDDRGKFTTEAGSFAGQHVFEANANIGQDLKSRGLLWHEEKIQHSYPHCWRCQQPIIFRATQQWFLKIDHQGLRGKLNELIQNSIQWIPHSGEERILGMIHTRPDWCLSRQRYWGVPIPAVICRGCQGEQKLYVPIIDRFAELVKKEGTDVWFERDIQEFIPSSFVCPDCKKADFEKTFDILDVWFDSGVSHQVVIKAMMHKELPVDLYLEGSDQHRGWFQSSLIPAVAMEGKAPYSEVLTHGFVVDGEGRKMSKSLGNVISPQDIIKNYGADILRLWIASSNYHEDIRLSKEIVDRLIDSYRKIRNTFRFLLGNLYDYDPMNDEVKYARLLQLDQWILYRLAEVLRIIQESYNQYEFMKVYKWIYTFCNEDLSSFYLDILKDRLYTSATQAPERRSAQTVLYYILNHFVRILAPILSFTSEEIFEFLPKTTEMKQRNSVHLLSWLVIPDEWSNPDTGKQFQLLMNIRPFVLKALEDQRKEEIIGSSLEAKLIFKSLSDQEYNFLIQHREILPSFFIVSQVEIGKVASISHGLGDHFPQTELGVKKADGQKCSRCWRYRIDVGKDQEHPPLCERCLVSIREFELEKR